MNLTPKCVFVFFCLLLIGCNTTQTQYINIEYFTYDDENGLSKYLTGYYHGEIIDHPDIGYDVEVIHIDGKKMSKEYLFNHCKANIEVLGELSVGRYSVLEKPYGDCPKILAEARKYVIEIDPKSYSIANFKVAYPGGYTVKWDGNRTTLDDIRRVVELKVRLKGYSNYIVNRNFIPLAYNETSPEWCERFIEKAYKRNINGVKNDVDTLFVNVNCNVANRGSALWTTFLKSPNANKSNTLEMAKYLVSEGADVNYTWKGRSVSNLAAYRGWSEAAAYIVSQGGSRTDAEAGFREANIDAQIFFKGLEILAKVPKVIKNTLKSSVDINDLVMISAEENCSVVAPCRIDNLNVFGGKSSFSKITESSTNGSINRSQGSVSGTYNWSLQVNDRQCVGTFNISESDRNITLVVNEDCSLQSVY